MEQDKEKKFLNKLFMFLAFLLSIISSYTFTSVVFSEPYAFLEGKQLQVFQDYFFSIYIFPFLIIALALGNIKIFIVIFKLKYQHLYQIMKVILPEKTQTVCNNNINSLQISASDFITTQKNEIIRKQKIKQEMNLMHKNYKNNKKTSKSIL